MFSSKLSRAPAVLLVRGSKSYIPEVVLVLPGAISQYASVWKIHVRTKMKNIFSMRAGIPPSANS